MFPKIHSTQQFCDTFTATESMMALIALLFSTDAKIIWHKYKWLLDTKPWGRGY